MPDFTLHPQLEKDSLFIRDLPLSQLRLNNQADIPWLILIPRRANIREFYELSHADAAQLMTDMRQAGQVLNTLYKPDKINTAALGNMVPQLHIHVIARRTSDVAWPAPIWGRFDPNPYAPDAAQATIALLNNDSFWTA